MNVALEYVYINYNANEVISSNLSSFEIRYSEEEYTFILKLGNGTE